MSKDGYQQLLLKFISTSSSQGTQSKYVDKSTSRSRPQMQTPQRDTPSASPLPAWKRKRLNTIQDQEVPEEKRMFTSMCDQPKSSDSKNSHTPKKKLTPEMQSLKDEINSDILAIKSDINTNMHSLIDPL